MNNNSEKKQYHNLLFHIRYLLIPYLVILVGCLVVRTIFTREQIYFAINPYHSAWADQLFIMATAAGDGLTVIVLAALMALFNYRSSFLLITSYGISALIAQGLKFVFERPRPYLYFAAQHSRMRLVDGVSMLTTHSFPSGHTVSAFSAAVVLTYLMRAKPMGLFFLLCALTIGFSRMYLSEHFFEDVTAGSAIGVFFTLFWVRWIDSRSFIHRDAWHKGLLATLKIG